MKNKNTAIIGFLIGVELASGVYLLWAVYTVANLALTEVLNLLEILHTQVVNEENLTR